MAVEFVLCQERLRQSEDEGVLSCAVALAAAAIRCARRRGRSGVKRRGGVRRKGCTTGVGVGRRGGGDVGESGRRARGVVGGASAAERRTEAARARQQRRRGAARAVAAAKRRLFEIEYERVQRDAERKWAGPRDTVSFYAARPLRPWEIRGLRSERGGASSGCERALVVRPPSRRARAVAMVTVAGGVRAEAVCSRVFGEECAFRWCARDPLWEYDDGG